MDQVIYIIYRLYEIHYVTIFLPICNKSFSTNITFIIFYSTFKVANLYYIITKEVVFINMSLNMFLQHLLMFVNGRQATKYMFLLLHVNHQLLITNSAFGFVFKCIIMYLTTFLNLYQNRFFSFVYPLTHRWRHMNDSVIVQVSMCVCVSVCLIT